MDDKYLPGLNYWEGRTISHRSGSLYFRSKEIFNSGNGDGLLTKMYQIKRKKETFELVLISELDDQERGSPLEYTWEIKEQLNIENSNSQAFDQLGPVLLTQGSLATFRF